MRQVANKPYCISQDQFHVIVDLHFSQGRIQCCKQLVLDIDIRFGDDVKQGRLAGIGISNQRHRGYLCLATGLPALLALLADFFQPLVDLLDTLPKQATVCFQLGFTRPPQANATFLALEVGPAPDQSRRQVLELRKLDLQLAFKGACTLSKYIEDKAGAIQYTAL